MFAGVYRRFTMRGFSVLDCWWLVADPIAFSNRRQLWFLHHGGLVEECHLLCFSLYGLFSTFASAILSYTIFSETFASSSLEGDADQSHVPRFLSLSLFLPLRREREAQELTRSVAVGAAGVEDGLVSDGCVMSCIKGDGFKLGPAF